MTPDAQIIAPDRSRGRLFTLAVPVLGIALWLVLWHFGFVAAAVAWLVAAATINLYRRGAGSVSRADVPWIVSVITVSIVLAFLSGMASDAAAAYVEQTKTGTVWTAVLSGDFWSFFFDNLMVPGLWSSYATDIIVAIVFGFLGAYSDIKRLYRDTKPADPLAAPVIAAAPVVLAEPTPTDPQAPITPAQ